MNKSEKKYFVLFSCCIVTRGYARSIIIDTQRNKFYFIPNELANLLPDLKKYELETIFDRYSEFNDRSILNEYLEFLYKNELGFYSNKQNGEDFPEINMEFKIPNIISNAIFDLKVKLPERIFDRFKELENLYCEAIQLRIFENLNIKEFSMMLKQLNSYSFRYIEILLNSSNEFTLPYLKRMLYETPNINCFILYSADSNEIFRINKSQFIETKSKILLGSNQCGQMGATYFNTNLNHVIESFNYNTCLNKKISFTENGEIRNCPSIKKNFGNNSTSINQVLNSSDFKKLWHVRKDEVEICKDCEFRHICTDCRYAIEEENNIYSKPKNCKYDPYTNIWNNKIVTICILLSVYLFSCTAAIKINSNNEINNIRDSAFSNYFHRKFETSYHDYNLLLNTKFATLHDMYYASHAAAFSGHYTRCLEIIELAIKKYPNPRAIHLVSNVIDTNWNYYESLKKENDFEQVYNLLQGPQQNDSFRSLSLLLNNLCEKDQHVRIKYLDNPVPENELIMVRVDSLNNKITDSILQQYGFLSYKKIGYKAYQSLFTLYQHLPKRSFIENFPLIQTAFRNKEILKPEYAYILDRYLIFNNKKQKFGTQYFYDSTLKMNAFCPIRRFAKVDKKRKKMGLEPLEEYARKNKIIFNNKKSNRKL